MQDNQDSQQHQKKKTENEIMREADVKRNVIPRDERMSMFSQWLTEKQIQLPYFVDRNIF